MHPQTHTDTKGIETDENPICEWHKGDTGRKPGFMSQQVQSGQDIETRPGQNNKDTTKIKVAFCNLY